MHNSGKKTLPGDKAEDLRTVEAVYKFAVPVVPGEYTDQM
jgi:hypothetical protein